LTLPNRAGLAGASTGGSAGEKVKQERFAYWQSGRSAIRNFLKYL